MKEVHQNSRDSFELFKKNSQSTFRFRIFELLKTQKRPMTDREIIDFFETDMNNIRPEITRMKQEGVLKEAGKGICPVTHRRVRLTTVSYL